MRTLAPSIVTHEITTGGSGAVLDLAAATRPAAQIRHKPPHGSISKATWSAWDEPPRGTANEMRSTVRGRAHAACSRPWHAAALPPDRESRQGCWWAHGPGWWAPVRAGCCPSKARPRTRARHDTPCGSAPHQSDPHQDLAIRYEVKPTADPAWQLAQPPVPDRSCSRQAVPHACPIRIQLLRRLPNVLPFRPCPKHRAIVGSDRDAGTSGGL